MYTKEQIEAMRSTTVVQGVLSELRGQRDDIVKRTDKIEFRIKNEDLNNDQIQELTGELSGLTDEARSCNALIDIATKTYNALEDEKRSMIDRQFTDQARIDRQGSDDDVYGSVEYRNAWLESVRQGDDSIVQRFLSTTGTAPNNGGVLVPTMIWNAIMVKSREGNRIASKCRIFNVKGLLTLPIEISATDATVHEEGSEAPTEEKITFGEVSLKPAMIKKWIGVTDELMALAIEAFGDYLVGEMTNKVLELQDKLILTNTQVEKGLKGILTVTDKNFVEELDAGGELTFATGYQAQAKLTSDSLGVVYAIMNRATFFANLMTLKDTNGRPIFTVANDNAGNPVHYMNGLPCLFTSALKDWDSAGSDDYPIVFGDLFGYGINYPAGQEVSLTIDPLTKAKEDRVEFIAKLFAGGAVIEFGKFVKIKKGTGTPS